MARRDTQQLRIMKLITTCLEQINPTNVDPSDDADGRYTLDLRGQVHRGKATFGKEQSRTFIAILESPQPLPVDGVGADEKIVRQESWQLLVQGFTEDDKTNPSDNAYWFKGLVEAQLAKLVMVDTATGNEVYPDLALTALAELNVSCVTIGQGVVRPSEPNVSASCYFYIPLRIDFASDVSKPFLM